jgi:hypothetical protein
MLTSGSTEVSSRWALVLGGVVEEGGDHEDRHDRVEDLDRHVVAELDGQLVVILAAPVGDHAPDDQAPHQEADAEEGDPGPDPQGRDSIGAFGDTLRQEAVDELAMLTPREGERGDHREHTHAQCAAPGSGDDVVALTHRGTLRRLRQ